MIAELLKRIKYAFDDHTRLIRSLSLNPKFWCVLIVDILLIVFSIYLSYTIRFEHTPNGADTHQVFRLIPLLIIVKLSCFYLFGLYRGMWRYTSTTDLLNILKASISAELIIVSWLLYLNRFEGLSRSVFILDALFTFLFITALRVVIRYYYRSTSKFMKVLPASQQKSTLKRLMLIGAGDAAEKVIREINDNHKLAYYIVGLVDDDPQKVGKKIHGIPVLGKIDDLRIHAHRFQADELLIAIASISGIDMKRIVALCQDSSIPFKVLPGIGELIDGKVTVDTIREIDYRDLLGREEIHLDQEQIGKYLSDKVILVTGAGGTIGSELCRQIIKFSPQQIILFDAGEENLYNMQMELLHEHNLENIIPILGKVQDLPLLNNVFTQYAPSVVFHAAAYKHVPLIENNPWQAIDNNIIGTQRLIEAAIVHKVHRFVLVSTDKAVNPTNVMGASKRMTELLMHAYSSNNWDGFLSPAWQGIEFHPDFQKQEKGRKHNTIFMAVRFGNVLGSSGSVIPLFKRQIQNGGPVTVTHPEITRYFMSIDEAAQLIIQAGSMGKGGGEIFILKMGAPIKISQMAEDLIRLAGKEPGVDIEIKFTGLREGEKLYEELITEGEGIADTNHGKIMVLRGNCVCGCIKLQRKIEKLKKGSESYDIFEIQRLFCTVISEYTPEMAGSDETILRQS